MTPLAQRPSWAVRRLQQKMRARRLTLVYPQRRPKSHPEAPA